MQDYAPLLERAFDFIPQEDDYMVGEIEGEIPPFVKGDYYVNGPARFSRGGVRYRHWLDGDGMVCHLHFGSEGVRLVNRFVRTVKWEREEEAGKAIFRTFGTAFEGDQLNQRGTGLESPANVSVYEHGGTLLAFGEQGLPYRLQDDTLQTQGLHTFGDRLSEVTPFAAHPKIDPGTGELFNFGVAFSALRPNLIVYRFDAQGGLVMRKRHPLDAPCSLHDFGLSPNHTCFYISPYVLDMQVLREGGSLIDSLSFEERESGRLIVAARESGGQRADLKMGPGYCLHVINTWEEDGLLHFDLVQLDEPAYPHYQEMPELFNEVGLGRPVRFTLDTHTWKLVEQKQLNYELAPDFPAIDPRLTTRRYDDFWMLGISAAGNSGRKFFDQLVRCRWSEPELEDLYQAPAKHYLGGEPIFIPDPESGNGVIICQIYDAQNRKASFALFDPLKINQGPLARLHLRHPIPPLFHASWTPAQGQDYDPDYQPGDDWFKK
ncbi:MAG TPA: carotenoid oxygenase family protein [Acidobacteriota bacterium]|nr:carotenoid oxygenase family protein [Acidobacteriota bacterium]